MIIIGHKALKSPKFRAIHSISDIDKTFANEVVFFSDSFEIARHCNECEITYAVEVWRVVDLMIYANLGAKYIVIRRKKLAQICQKLANEYFLDSKILLVVRDEKGIDSAANLAMMRDFAFSFARIKRGSFAWDSWVV